MKQQSASPEKMPILLNITTYFLLIIVALFFAASVMSTSAIAS